MRLNWTLYEHCSLSNVQFVLLHRSNLTTLTLQSDAAIKELQQKKEKVSLELENVLVNKPHCVYTHWAVPHTE